MDCFGNELLSPSPRRYSTMDVVQHQEGLEHYTAALSVLYLRARCAHCAITASSARRSSNPVLVLWVRERKILYTEGGS